MKMQVQFMTKWLLVSLLTLLIMPSTYAQQNEEGKVRARQLHEKARLVDPATGEIPENIRTKELNFVYADPSLRKNKQNQRVRRWTAQGPFNVGGRTRALAIDRSNPRVILAGGASGGMWRSDDDGQSWTKTTGVNENQSVTSIAQDPRPGMENIWYYGTGEIFSSARARQRGALFFGKGVYRSTDGGLTWVLLTNTNSFNNSNFSVVHKVVVDNQGAVFAATFNGIYRSTDGGTNWTRVLGERFGSFDYTNIERTPSGILYVSLSTWNFTLNNGKPSTNRNGGIFRSYDSGNTWTKLNFPKPLGDLLVKRAEIAVSQRNENHIFFLLNTHNRGTGKGKSANNKYSLFRYIRSDTVNRIGNFLFQVDSADVTDFTKKLPDFKIAQGVYDGQFAYNQLIKVHPNYNDVLFVGGTSLTRVILSLNPHRIGGYHPRLRNGLLERYPNHHPDNHAIVFYPNNPNRMLSGHDGGVSRTENNLANIFTSLDEPVAWEELNEGYATTQAYSVSIDRFNGGDRRMLAGFQDQGKWYTNELNSGNPWQEEAWGADGAFTAIVSGAAVRYLGTQNGVIGRVEGAPAGIQGPINFVHPEGTNGTWFIHPFILNKNDERMMFYSKGNSMWRNKRVDTLHNRNSFGTNRGWENLNTANKGDGPITALDVSLNNDKNVLYYGTNNGRIYRINNAHATNHQVVDIWSNKNLPTANVSSIAVDPGNSDNVMITFSNYNVNSIFYTSNGGKTWLHVGGNLDDRPKANSTDRNGPSVRWAEIHRPATGGVVYLVGTSVGLYSSERLLDNNKTRWTQEGDLNIGNVVVSMVESRGADNLVAVATHGNGLYSVNLSATLSQSACLKTTNFTPYYIGFNAAAFGWDWTGASGYTVRYRVKGTFDWTYLPTGYSGANLYGLTENTTYEIQVKTNCESEQVYTASKEFTTAKINYRFSRTTKTMITQVKLADIVHSTPTYTQEYNDFTNISTDLAKGVATPLSIAHRNSNEVAYVKIWIDFNQNGSFTDEGDEVIHRVTATGTAPFVVGNIVVPKDAKSGKTKMRIAIMPKDFPATTGAAGEVEDYTVNITSDKIASQLSADVYEAKLYPNPVNRGQTVSAEVNLKSGDQATFTLYNSQGVKLSEKLRTYNHSQKTVALFETNDLATGIYIVRVVINGQVKKSLRLVVK